MEFKYYAVVTTLLFTVMACSSDQQGDSKTNLPQLSIEPLTQITESGDLMLSSIQQVLVDSEGYIIISDSQQRYLHALDPAGNFLHTIGGRGAGPGEYEFPGPAILDSHDRLHMLDFSTRNMIVYEKNGSEWQFESDFSPDVSVAGFFSQFFPEENGEYVIINRTNPFSDDDELSLARRINTSNEIVADTLHILEDNEMFTVTGGSGQAMMALTVPEIHRQGRFLADYDGNFYYSWTENLHIDRLSPGDSAFSPLVRHDLANRPFTAADGDTVITRYENMLDGDNQIIRDLRAEFPDYKPVLRNIIADDNGYIWAHTFTEYPEGEWLIFDPDGEPVFRTSFPESDRVITMRHNQVYAVTESDEGLPAIQVYTYSL